MRFATGFMSIDRSQYKPEQLRGRNWRVRFSPPADRSTASYFTRRGNRDVAAKEILIVAESETVARRAVSRILGAMTLLQGSSSVIADLPLVRQQDQDSAVKRLHNGAWSISGLPLACRIAVQASRRRRLEYALAKFKLSSETSSFDWIDLDPDHSETIPRWHRAEDHVRLATAIVLAYSVIEELGLEVRASDKKQSSINGQWNPEVKQELENRLRRARIDLSNPVVWSVRGGKSRLETERPKHLFATSTRTSWTR
jgi:hypothetical protein